MPTRLFRHSSARRLVVHSVPALAFAGFLLAGLSAAHALNYYWDPGATATGTGSGGTANWNTTAGNNVWFDGTVDNIWANANPAFFAGAAGTVTVNGAVNPTGITISTGGYTFIGTAAITVGASGMNINASPGGVTTISAPINIGSSQTWTTTTGNTLNLSGNMTNGPVIFGGPGIVNISSTTFTVNKFTIKDGATINWSGTSSLPAAGGYTGAGDGTAGTLNVTAGNLSTAAAVFAGNNTTGSISVSGGTFTMTGNLGLVFGDGYNNNQNGTGSLNLSSTGKFTTGTTTGIFYLGNTGSGAGTVNLDGGTLATNRTITKSAYSGSGGTGGSGTFNFNGGTLQATGTALALTGLTHANVRNGGAVIDTNSFNVTIAQNLEHSNIGTDNATDGGFTKKGNGILTLTGTETYTGATTVTAGTLLVNNALFGTARVDVAGTLGGNGLIAPASGATGQVALASGAHLAPGNNGVGTLTLSFSGGDFDVTGSVSGANTSAFTFELGSTASSDLVSLNGGPLTIGSGQLDFADFSFSTLAGFDTAGTYTLFAGDTAINGTLGAGTIGSIGGQFFQLQLADSNTDLVLVSVPEPTSAVLLLAGLAGLSQRRRRK